MPIRWIVVLIAVFAGAAAAAVIWLRPPPPRTIPFVAYGESYLEKPDFAALERQAPLGAADLASLQAADLKAFNQEQLDQLYARLTAGPLPDGAFAGEVLRVEGAPLDRIAESIGGLKGLALRFKRAQLEIVVQALWRGKVFYRAERIVRNRIDDLEPLRPLFAGAVPPATAREKEEWLLFPAKLYCGQSLVDGRRESIIVDYAFADEIPGYQELPDYITGRKGFRVRDEIRMIRPGFYLGRAYLDRFFALNFILHNPEVEKRERELFMNGKVKQACWTGTQARTASS